MKPRAEFDFLISLTDFGIKLGLDKTRGLLQEFGNPHNKLPSVLIAGTNGKGSVARTLASILQNAGYKTGLYTSPHLSYLGERILLNGDCIPEEIFIKKIKALQKIVLEQPYPLYPTFFEALTAIAFSFFMEVEADIVICEVGMGGRFDATNVLPSEVEVITRIGIDHTQYLGKTYEEIASEKAGIIKEGSIVISAAQQKNALKVLRKKAEERGAQLYLEGRDFYAERISFDPFSGQRFNFYGKDNNYHSLQTPLLGRHQIGNMSLAIQAANLLAEKGFKITNSALRNGVKNLSWPCRFQILREKPLLIIDGAHNPDGMASLTATLDEVFSGKKISFLTGILKDKDWRKMLTLLLRNSNIRELVFTKPDNARAVDPKILAAYVKDKKGKGGITIKTKVIPLPSAALAMIGKSDRDWCICGSLYLCGEIITRITENGGLFFDGKY